MTKRKKDSCHKRPWTPFVEADAIDDNPIYVAGDAEAPAQVFVNSRYQVSVWSDGDEKGTMGEWLHLSIRDHDRSARHDWRDLQRIKNELAGPEFEAIEIYPAESRLVDTANQYHLYVFRTWKPPMGFASRLVADGAAKFAPKAEQRPFEERPADCLNGAELDALLAKLVADSAERRRHGA
jgi:hypothetical protein